MWASLSLQHGSWAPRGQDPRVQALLVTGIFLTQAWSYTVSGPPLLVVVPEICGVCGRVTETHDDLMGGVSGSQANLSMWDQR